MAGHQHTDDARTSTRRLTYHDFLLFPDDGRRHELIDGEHCVTPSPNLLHQELLKRLTFELESHLRQHGGGRMFYAPLDCVLTDHDIVEPDALVVVADQLGIITKKHVRGAPALMIEIISPRTRHRDRRFKRDLYARTGVREYWMVDPKASSIAVFRRGQTGDFPLVAALSASASDRLETPLLPGFSLPLADYFR